MTTDGSIIGSNTIPDLVRLAKERDATKKKQAIEEALALAGSWRDLDWDEMEAALDRIRHESKPTPPCS